MLKLYELQVKNDYGYIWKTIYTDSNLENVYQQFERLEKYAENFNRDFRIYELIDDEIIIEF